MSLQFIIGSSGIGKTHYACQRIIQESLENPGKLYYIIVPEQFTMQTQKNVVEMHPGKGILNIDVLSFQRLAYRVFEEVGGAREVLLDDTGKSLVLQKLVQQHKKELPYLGSQMNKPGYLDEVKSLMDAALKTFGRIDILVNNAGITRDGLLMMMKPEDFDAVIAANLRGAFLCMKAVARQMVKQRYGRIVNLSSVVGLRGNAGQVNYAASKAGVIGMTKSLAKELAGRNITVNAVAPGFIDTDMTAALTETAKNAALGSIPMGRMGTPENGAKAVAFLAGEDAGYITGQVLAVDGGMSM